MNKALFFLIGISAIALFTLIVLVLARINVSPAPTAPTTTPTKFVPPVPAGETIESSGVEIKNPFTGAEDLNVRGDALTVDAATYSIVYLKDFDEFIISIKVEPFEANRQVAENEFLNRLGISQIEACNLKVSVMPPINKSETTQKYRLSFCDQP